MLKAVPDGAPMRVLVWVVLGVAILTAPSLTYAGTSGVPCCLPNSPSCQILSPVACESAGGDFPLADTCDDPNPCIVCCRSGEPLSCEDNVTFRECVGRANLQEYTSRASCGSEGQCVPFAPVLTAPALAPWALLLALVILPALGVRALRHRARGAR